MKRIFILVVIALSVSGAVSAEEAILIDFAKLAADIFVDPGSPASEASGDQAPNQNRQTMMDFSGVAGNSFTAAQKQVMKTSLAIANWEVVLASSSRTVVNQSLSFTAEAPSRQWTTVMGTRIHFPVEPFNSWARISPPFEIPAYDWDEVAEDGSVSRPVSRPDPRAPSRFEEGYGVVKNVGSIKAVAVNAYGLNFPHGLSTVIIDNEGNERVVFMGFLQYDGWAELRWDNPVYLQEVRNRELRLYPLYPTSTPFVKFGGFLIQRDASRIGGDFICYFKDVKIIYDKAVLDTDRDIDDESLWGIIQTREDQRKAFEVRRFGQTQVLRYLEGQRQAVETEFTPSPTNEQQ